MNPYTNLYCDNDNLEIIKSKNNSRKVRVNKTTIIESDDQLIRLENNGETATDVIEITITSPEVSKPQIGENFRVTVVEVASSYCVLKFMKNNVSYEGYMLISNLKEFKPLKGQKFFATIIHAQYNVPMSGKIYDFFDFEKV